MKWLLATLSLSCLLTSHGPGVVIIVGGGKVPESVQQHFVQLAGGKEAHIAVLPQASSRPTRGESSVAMFTALGANAYIVPLDDPEQARSLIHDATGIWFPGGSQTRLYDALRDAKLIDFLRARHHAGLTFAGSSAGAWWKRRVMPSSSELEAPCHCSSSRSMPERDSTSTRVQYCRSSSAALRRSSWQYSAGNIASVAESTLRTRQAFSLRMFSGLKTPTRSKARNA